MSERLKALREKRGKIAADMRAILDGADAAKRAATSEEIAKHGTLFDEAERLRLEIEAGERQEALDRELAARQAPPADAAPTGRYTPTIPAVMLTPKTKRNLESFFAALDAEFRAEYRATLQSGSDIGGGYLLPAEQMVDDLIKAVDNAVFIRPLATKFRVPAAESLGVPTLETDPADADWTTELATGSEDTSTEFGKRALHPHPMAKRVKISKDLIMRLPSFEAFLNSRIAYKIGITEEKGFLTGTGAGQPLGIYTASNDGIGTARDVSTGNTTTAITFDGLINAKYSVKGAYWGSARWNFHRDAMKMISKLKDGDGQYLWRASVREGEPDTILGHPIDVSEYTPNTFTTGLYVGMFGDYTHYWIADAMDVELQRLVELYAETNQIGIIARVKADGMPVLAEAFARVTLA